MIYVSLPLRVMLVIVLTLGISCQHARNRSKTASNLHDPSYARATVQLASVTELTQFLRELRREDVLAKAADQARRTQTTTLLQRTDQEADGVVFSHADRTVVMTTHAVQQLKTPREQRIEHFQTRATTVDSYLRAATIDTDHLTDADFATAYLELLALISGDESVVSQVSQGDLSLTLSTQKVSDIVELARLGKNSWDNLLSGVPAAFKPSTWGLIERNRRLLGFAAYAMDTVGPDTPKARFYGKLLRQMVTASEVMSGLRSPVDFSFDQIPDWDQTQ